MRGREICNMSLCLLVAPALSGVCSTSLTRQQIGATTGAVEGGVAGAVVSGGAPVGTVAGGAAGGVVDTGFARNTDSRRK